MITRKTQSLKATTSLSHYSNIQNSHLAAGQSPLVMIYNNNILTIRDALKRPTSRSKPWWSKELTHLRQNFHRTARAHRRGPSPSSLSEARTTKRLYFKAIQRAKAEHWKAFLSKVDSKTVWTAKRLAEGRDSDKFPSFPDATSPADLNSSLLNHFFPPKPHSISPSFLRTDPHAPSLEADEISRALSKSSNMSAPGPDQINYQVWKKVNAINPSILLGLLSPLLALGYHPSSLKRANGIVLPKPGKADYSSPASFRIIVLLETVSKILECIIAMRLSILARTVGLLDTNQCGSLAGLSTFDAAASLTHDVRSYQWPGTKVSSLFLDIKGGFDNISASSLTALLRSKGIPTYLVSWVRSFLFNRRCRLICQGAALVFSPVSVSTPQGSPVSPLLFVI